MSADNEYRPQPILPKGEYDRLPPMPPGTIFVVGAEGGYAVPPQDFTLVFGRERGRVHVPLGTDDKAVSRRHGEFSCISGDSGWWLRNTGQLPIELPNGVLLLNEHERLLEPGYTPLVINSSRQRAHLLEVRVTSLDGPKGECKTDAETIDPDGTHDLSPAERLVLTALAARYLEGYDGCPQPLTWEQAAEIANHAPRPTKSWSKKSVAYAVDVVRLRLSKRGVPGLTREEIGEPVGNTLSHNLIQELLRTATLDADDLRLLGGVGGLSGGARSEIL